MSPSELVSSAQIRLAMAGRNLMAAALSSRPAATASTAQPRKSSRRVSVCHTGHRSFLDLIEATGRAHKRPKAQHDDPARATAASD